MKPIDPRKLHEMEDKAREIGHLIGNAIKGHCREKNLSRYGFALMMFSFDGAELTWISDSNRDDMIKLLDEFKQALENNNADALSRPKGRG